MQILTINKNVKISLFNLKHERLIHIFRLSIIALIFLNYNIEVHAQQKSMKKPASSIQMPELQLGLKTGLNFARINSTQEYNVLESTDGTENSGKKYKNSRSGMQLGFTAAYGLNQNISFLASPVYTSFKFGYENKYSWIDAERTTNHTNLNFSHEHVLHYIEIPLSVKYHILSGKIKPYIETGGFYGILQSANKTISTTRTDNASGEQSIEVNDVQTIGIKNLFISSNLGVLGGAGIRYDIGRVSSLMTGSTNLGVISLVFSGIYKYGLNNITNVRNRYADNRTVMGAYDVLDDIRMNNIEISMACLFTLKYKNK